MSDFIIPLLFGLKYYRLQILWYEPWLDINPVLSHLMDVFFYYPNIANLMPHIDLGTTSRNKQTKHWV